MEGNKCFKCHVFGRFKLIVTIERPLPLAKVEEIQALKDESSEEEDGNDAHTLITLDVGELLLIKRSLHVTKTTHEESQTEQIFNSRCTIGGKVCGLIVDGDTCTNVASNTLIDKF